MEIQVQDCGTNFLDYHQLKEFQGNFKERTEEDIQGVKESIIKRGFSFPMFVWENGGHYFVLDGHGRLAALRELEAEGNTIPRIPVVYVQTKTREEAIRVLLLCNSRYGYITEASTETFMDKLDYSDLISHLNVDDIVIVDEKAAGERKVRYIYCPKCGAICDEDLL
jgi:hypothetical protein